MIDSGEPIRIRRFGDIVRVHIPWEDFLLSVYPPLEFMDGSVPPIPATDIEDFDFEAVPWDGPDEPEPRVLALDIEVLRDLETSLRRQQRAILENDPRGWLAEPEQGDHS